MRPLRAVIAGGGTGGHLYPGIAVARELLRRDPEAQVTFAGTARGIESRVIPKEGFALDLLRSAGLKGRSAMGVARAVGLLPLSAMDGWHILSRRSPDVVIGVGGYSSGPVLLMAVLRRIPTLLMEQNAVPGLTNRLLARLVDAAAVSFDPTLAFFGRKGVVTGNPVRPEFFVPAAAAAEREHPAAPVQPRVLVFGGSQGAHAINQAMVDAAPGLAALPGGVAITHQTGDRDVTMVREGYARAGLTARVEPFLYAMDQEMKAADLVICRAGATTLAELTAAGRASVLIPLPTATDDHQRVNAGVLGAAGAADVIEQRQATGAVLAARIAALVGDRERLAAMGHAAATLAKPQAAPAIADMVMSLAATRRLS